MVAVPTTWVPEHRNMETSLSWPTVDMWHEWEIWLIPSLKWPGWGNWGPKRTEIRPASQSWLPRGTEQQESTSGTPSSYLSFIHHWASCTFCKSLPLLTQSIFCFCKLTQRLNLTNHCLIFINCLLVHTLRTQFFQKVEGEGMGVGGSGGMDISWSICSSHLQKKLGRCLIPDSPQAVKLPRDTYLSEWFPQVILRITLLSLKTQDLWQLISFTLTSAFSLSHRAVVS